MERIRVLHLVKTSVGATWALRQVRELVKLGVEVSVGLPAGGPLVPQYEAVGANVYVRDVDFPARRPHRFPAIRRAILDLVEQVRPDLIHCHHVGTALSARLALGKSHQTPRLFQVPGPLHLEHPVVRRAEIATGGPHDYWIGSCQWTCDRYAASGIPADRLFLSYYGIDVENFVPRQPGKLRRELGLDTSTPVVGMVAFIYAPKRYLGQTRGLKGHEDLFDAVAECLSQDPSLHCVVIGGAWNGAVWYERRVKEYARATCGDRVIFLGTRSDIPDLYADIDVVCCPSHSENVGGAAESLMLAVPTIATTVGGFPDLVRPGETGWLVPPRDPAALARAIREALADRAGAKQMALRGQALARHLFDVRRTAAEVHHAYRRILARESTAAPAGTAARAAATSL
jgi:glycosyltransferase involved in cell wall biosynthesis